MALKKRIENLDQKNLISLKRWREKASLLNEEKGLSDYYGQLNFSSLVNEASHVLKEIEENEFQSETAIQCRILLKEIQSRLEQKCALDSIRENLDSRFLDLIIKE